MPLCTPWPSAPTQFQDQSACVLWSRSQLNRQQLYTRSTWELDYHIMLHRMVRSTFAASDQHLAMMLQLHAGLMTILIHKWIKRSFRSAVQQHRKLETLLTQGRTDIRLTTFLRSANARLCISKKIPCIARPYLSSGHQVLGQSVCV